MVVRLGSDHGQHEGLQDVIHLLHQPNLVLLASF